MKLVNYLLGFYDKIIIPLADNLVNRDTIRRRLYDEFRLNLSGDKDSSEFKYYVGLVEVIHSRVSTLVGHLSIMIAVSIFALDKIDSDVGEFFLSIEVVLYIALTVYTIRALKSSGLQQDHDSVNSYMEELKDELSLKYAISQSSLALTILLTILLCIFTTIGFLFKN